MPRLILQVDAKQAAPVIASLQRQLGSLGVTAQVTERRLGGVSRSAHGSRNAFQDLHRAGNVTSAMFVRMGAAMAGLGFARLAIDVKDSWLALDRFSRAFRAGAGSAELGGQQLAFVREQTHRLGLDFQSTAESYSRFMVAMRIGGASMADTQKVFKSVAETATVLGLSNERVEKTFLAFEQMVSKGRVSMEELRRQLGQHIPGAMQIAADAMGVTTAKLFKMVETGQLLSKELVLRFAEELPKVFGPELASALDSPQVAFGRLRTAIFELKVAAGDELVPALTEMSRLLYNLAQSEETKDAIYSLSRAFADLVENMNKAMSGSDEEEGGIAKLAEFFRSIERELNNIVQAQNKQEPIIDVPEGWERFKGFLEDLPTLLSASGEAARNSAKQILEFFAEGFGSALERLSDGWDHFWGQIIKAAGQYAQVLTEQLESFLGSRIFKAFSDTFDRVSAFLGRWSEKAGSGVASRFSDSLKSGRDFLDEALGGWDEAFADTFRSLVESGKKTGKDLATNLWLAFLIQLGAFSGGEGRDTTARGPLGWLANFFKIDRDFQKNFEESLRLVERLKRETENLKRGKALNLEGGIEGLPASLEETIRMLKKAGKDTSRFEALLKKASGTTTEWTDRQKNLVERLGQQATVQAHLASKIGESETARWRAKVATEAWLELQKAETTAQTDLGKEIVKNVFNREIQERLLENEKTLLKNREKLLRNDAKATEENAEALAAVNEELARLRSLRAIGIDLEIFNSEQVKEIEESFKRLFQVPDLELLTPEQITKAQDIYLRFKDWLARERKKIEKLPIELQFEPTYEDYLSDLREAWERNTIDLGEVWRGFVEGMQDIFASTFRELFRGNIDSWKDLWSSVKNLALDTLSEIAARWATQQFAMNVYGAGGMGGGGGWMAALGKMFGGGGGSALETGVYGPTQSGGNIAGGGGANWGAIGSWAIAAAAVAAILYSEGVIGAKGRDAVGGVTFGGTGGERLQVLDKFANRPENIKVVEEKVLAAFEKIGEFLESVELEIDRFGQVTVQKKADRYQIEAHGVISAGIGAIDTAGMTADEVADAIAALTIRTADFGDSVSEFLEAVIRGSRAITTEQLEAEIELGRMVESFGKTEFQLDVEKIGFEMDKIFDWLGTQLSKNAEQLSHGLDLAVGEEARRWRERYNELLGIEPTQQELLQQAKQNARIFEAEKALRLADLKARVIELEAKKKIEESRARLGVEDLRFQKQLLDGEQSILVTRLGFERSRLEGQGEIWAAEEKLAVGHLETMGKVVSAGGSILDIQIDALNELIDAISSIPKIDLSKIKVPGVGGGVDTKASDRDQLRGILDAFDLSLLGEVERGLAEINLRYEEHKRLAHGDAELLERVNEMRSKEIELLRETIRAQVEPFLPELRLGGVLPGGGNVSGDLGEWGERAKEIEAWAEDLIKQNELLLKETGEAALETWKIVAAEANRMRELVGEAIGSLGLPLEQTRTNLETLGQTLRFLESQVNAGILSHERYAEVVRQVADQQFLALGDALLGFVERYYGDVAGFEDFRMKLEQVRFIMEFANLQLQFQLLQELGILTKEQILMVQGVIDWINENEPTFPNLPQAPAPTATTPGGGGVSEAQRERERALEILQGFLDLELSPYERELADLTRTFDDLRRVLGNTIDVQRAWELALEDLNERYTQGLRDFLETLRDPSLTPAQSVDTLRQRFLGLAGTGDISRSDELLQLAEQLRQAYGETYGTAGLGFQHLLDLIEQQILMFLGEAGPAGSGSSPVANPATGGAAAGPVNPNVAATVGQGNSILLRIEGIMAQVEQNTSGTNQALAQTNASIVQSSEMERANFARQARKLANSWSRDRSVRLGN